MYRKLIFITFLAIYSVSAKSGHQIDKRQTSGVDNGLVSASNQWTQFLSDTWNSLRNNLRLNESQSRIDQINTNLTFWRNSLANASSDAAQDMMARLQNMTHHLNTVLRERANNDQNLVHRLYDMIVDTTRNGTNHSMENMRRAFTTATQTMAENYSGLANHSLQLASDMRNKSSQLFNSAMIMAGNDTNRAVIAANTAINAIRNSSQPINETIQGVAINLAQSARKLSAELRNLMNQTPVESSVENIAPAFREKAEQSLQMLMSSMNRLRNSLGQFSTNANAIDNNSNVEENEINVIQTASKALSKESEDLQNQINALRSQSESLNNLQ